MKKFIIFIFGTLSYLMFLGVFIYAIGFIGNFGGISNSIDSIPGKPLSHALMINLGLLSFFAIQHSGMARKGFKNWMTKYIPETAERSTYVLWSNIAMILIFMFWEPMGGTVWSFSNEFAKSAILSIYMFGWAIVLISTFLINHFHLFGLQQVCYQLVNKPIPESNFHTPAFYKWVRHPLYVGWIVVFWSAPTMTVAHLLFAMMCTAYILIAIRLEEKDLVDEFGDTYIEYKKKVPMLIPSKTVYGKKLTAAELSQLAIIERSGDL